MSSAALVSFAAPVRFAALSFAAMTERCGPELCSPELCSPLSSAALVPAAKNGGRQRRLSADARDAALLDSEP